MVIRCIVLLDNKPVYDLVRIADEGGLSSGRMKKLLIPALCLLHMTAIFWWNLPHGFGGMVSWPMPGRLLWKRGCSNG